MKIKYTRNEFNLAKSGDKLKLECYTCLNIFERPKKEISFELKNNRGYLKYCSINCINNKFKTSSVTCLNCNKIFNKKVSEIPKSGNNYCSRSCAATYNNTHKSTGNRRSKLEIWLEAQLTALYPDLHIDFNKKDAIDSELDIYIPSLSLAFELNGVFHYEPIYGPDKLGQIKNNDNSKSKACFDKQIDLCVIDVSGLINFKPIKAQKYLDIIINIIKERLLIS